MVGPTGWAERGKERAELAGTAAWGWWLKAEETGGGGGRGCEGWFPCLASRNRYAGGSSAPPTPPTPYVIAPRRPNEPLFPILHLLLPSIRSNFYTSSRLRGIASHQPIVKPLPRVFIARIFPSISLPLPRRSNEARIDILGSVNCSVEDVTR